MFSLPEHLKADITIVREVFVKILLESFGKLSISMSPPIRRKYHDSVAFATGCKRIKNSKRCNRKIRIPIAMWPCRVEEKMTLKEVDGQTVEEIETKIIAKDGTITRVPGKFQGYETSEEEPLPLNMCTIIVVHAKCGVHWSILLIPLFN
ncbi:hypothetical protein Tco_1246005 [Tanacetum coccineum]